MFIQVFTKIAWLRHNTKCTGDVLLQNLELTHFCELIGLQFFLFADSLYQFAITSILKMDIEGSNTGLTKKTKALIQLSHYRRYHLR